MSRSIPLSRNPVRNPGPGCPVRPKPPRNAIGRGVSAISDIVMSATQGGKNSATSVDYLYTASYSAVPHGAGSVRHTTRKQEMPEFLTGLTGRREVGTRERRWRQCSEKRRRPLLARKGTIYRGHLSRRNTRARLCSFSRRPREIAWHSNTGKIPVFGIHRQRPDRRKADQGGLTASRF